MPGQHRRAQLRALLRRVGLGKLDATRLEPAFAHESAVGEGAAPVSNERLEFLGDAVLGVVTSRWLYERYPKAREGELALRKKPRFVSDAALARSAERLGFGPLLVVGRGLAKAAGHPQPSLLADAFEAFVAAVFLSGGIDLATGFVITQHLVPHEAGNPALIGMRRPRCKSTFKPASARRRATSTARRVRRTRASSRPTHSSKVKRSEAARGQVRRKRNAPPPRTHSSAWNTASAKITQRPGRGRNARAPRNPRTREAHVAPALRVQDLCRSHDGPFRARDHGTGRPERLGEIESRRRVQVGPGRAQPAQPALDEKPRT